VRVVDVLEVVEIDPENRDLAALAPGLGDRHLQPLLAQAPVRQPGEYVVIRVQQQLLMEALMLEDQRRHRTDHVQQLEIARRGQRPQPGIDRHHTDRSALRREERNRPGRADTIRRQQLTPRRTLLRRVLV
jgi:hypothetical protein